MFLKNSTGYFNGAVFLFLLDMPMNMVKKYMALIPHPPLPYVAATGIALVSSEAMADLSHLEHEEVLIYEFKWQTFYENIWVISKQISTVCFSSIRTYPAAHSQVAEQVAANSPSHCSSIIRTHNKQHHFSFNVL